MKVRSNSLYIFFVGFALFSMFFGAYNLAFPLVMGQKIPLNTLPIALLGSFVSFILLPIFGFYGIAVYDGNYREFFLKLGKILGLTIVSFIMIFFGPLGALSRCMSLTFPFAQILYPSLCVKLYMLCFCFALFVCTMRKSFMMAILGKVLAPLLFLAVVLVSLFALITPAPLVSAVTTATTASSFQFGFFAGYFSMSFILGFFFCYLVGNAMKRISLLDQHVDKKLLVKNDVRSMLWASCLLFISSCGLAYTASKFSSILGGVTIDQLLPTLLLYLFGAHGQLIAFIIILLACFTTAIGLTAIFADYLRHDVVREKISYQAALGLTLLVAYFVSVNNFMALFYFLAPILYELLPGLIILTLLNIGHKNFRWKISKISTILLFLGAILVARSFL